MALQIMLMTDYKTNYKTISSHSMFQCEKIKSPLMRVSYVNMYLYVLEKNIAIRKIM